MADKENSSPTTVDFAQLFLGLNLDNITSQIKPGMWTYSLNALVENFDGNGVTIQNEEGNVLCTNFPAGYKVVGAHNIIERNLIFVLLGTDNGLNSEIGLIDTNTCTYITKANDPCLGFRLDFPVLKMVHKNTHRGTEVYWTDNNQTLRYIDIDNIPFKEIPGTTSCDNIITTELDCNKLAVQPNFSLPQLSILNVEEDGEVEAGDYQFGIQYSNALSEAYTSYFSITNPIGLFDPTKITQDFNYKLAKSIDVKITNLDTTGYYDYFNLAVIKTVNNISTPYLVGTYRIVSDTQIISYTGQNKTEFPLSLEDILQKYPVYNKANDITTAQDVLIWSDLTLAERISYQEIASKIELKWETFRESYSNAYQNPEVIYPTRGYMRDEIYALEFVPLLTRGRQGDGFHIPARPPVLYDIEPVANLDDVISEVDDCVQNPSTPPRWQVYNTGNVEGYSQTYLDSVANLVDPKCYVGPYQYGNFAYWESTELYPCDTQMWGQLANTPIRHHKFPDSLITHIHDVGGYIYPIGIRIDVEQIKNLILNSSLTQAQKDEIIGFKIVRSNRATNKSVVAKGLIHNVLKYTAKDNQISFTDRSTGGGTTTSTNPVYSLVLRASSLVQSAIQAITFGYFSALAPLTNAKNALDNALLQPINSPQFNADLLTALTKIQFVLNDKYNDAMYGYLQGAVETIGAIQETATAYAQLGTLNIDNLTSTQDGFYYYPNYLFNDVRPSDPFLNNVFVDDSSKERYTFHSPDTSFFQPSLGSILKLETAESGFSNSHIVQVKNHAKYQFITTQAYITALLAGLTIGFASGTYGLSTNVFNGTAAMTSYQAILDIIFKITPKKNFAYQFNAVGNYDIPKPVQNTGNKQRKIDIGRYLLPGFEDVGDNLPINNWQRESSVYLKTNTILPYVDTVSGIHDISKTIIPSFDTFTWPISSYYASIKKQFKNQYGQMYSYQTIDTGYQKLLDFSKTYTPETIFGGDIFINKFAYKSKIPFFIDNRVGDVNDSDVFYNELSNIGKVKYWFSTDVIEKQSVLSSLFGIKAHKFFWNRSSFFNYDGSIFLFAYGIPNFYCESEVNVDYRQAYNTKEGDFYPRVGTGIPDSWLQETNVSIANDNTYFYNKTYSLQNQYTNVFTHLPPDFFEDVNREDQPFRAIFSEPQEDVANYRRNNWLIYRPAAKFDFPQNYGKLTSLDGIENKQVLARFENKTLLYNALLTMPTSTSQAYLGQSLFNQQVPPIDYADTDLGYAGSQHKFLLKTEYGHITTDAKRGQIFILNGQQAKELTNENVSKFFTEFLQFEIKKAFPTFNIDNNYNGCGLHGVYDPKYDRFIITKIDYKPLLMDIIYKNGVFVYNNQQIELTNEDLFCNNSFTISYSFKTQSWTSFHSYIPNYYVGNSNFFYSGINDTPSLWKHNSTFTLFNSFYGQKAPYIIEYPIYYKGAEEILQSIKDYSRILKYSDYQTFIQTDDQYFTHAVIFNDQQCSGTLKLTKKPQNSLAAYGKYPIYSDTEKEILFTKSNSLYQFNTFWALNRSSQEPIWKKSCKSLSIYKELNEANMNYSKRAYKKAPMMAKDTRIRLINNEHTDVKFVSQFLITDSQISYK